MTALAPTLSLEQLEEIELQLAESCRFCSCTESTPCPIFLHHEPSGIVRLARTEEEANDFAFCAWYVPGVCNSPLCIEKLLEEKRGKVILFDAQSQPLKRAEGR
jgi:hypothetical protein